MGDDDAVSLGTKRVCVCGRVIMVVADRTVISLIAGVWVHVTMAGKLFCGYARPSS